MLRNVDVSRTKLRRQLAAAGFRGEHLAWTIGQIEALQYSTKPKGGIERLILGCEEKPLRSLIGGHALRKLIRSSMAQHLTRRMLNSTSFDTVRIGAGSV